MLDMKEKIKVLVVDDASFMRKAVSNILSSDDGIEVVGTAKDGLDALEKIKQLRPDVITLDIDMPRMDGLTAIRHIMIKAPVPIVVLSSLSSDGAITFEALRLGVVDFIPKPSGAISTDIEVAKHQLVDRIKMAATVNLTNIRRVRLMPLDIAEDLSTKYGFRSLEYLLALGTTISGPNTVIRLMMQLPTNLPVAVVVVQEIAPNILPAFAAKFDEHVPWRVKVAEEGEQLHRGTCYVSSSEHALSVEVNDDGVPILRRNGKVSTPLNKLFTSSAEAFGQHSIGLLLTGVGSDGAEGLSKIRETAGVAMAQAASTCVYPNLTDHAVSQGVVDMVLNENDLPETICSLME
jgi:two-component system chemotaxis response regulator CheB